MEMGVSNQLFPQERDEAARLPHLCDDPGRHQQHAGDEPVGCHGGALGHRGLRQLHAHAGSADTGAQHPVDGERPQSICRAWAALSATRRPSPPAAPLPAALRRNPSRALSNQQVNLFSDLLVHHMGDTLADGITQGAAGPDEFRTAPLWGLGQRIFFLHDGRTRDLVAAIEAHSSNGSEANSVIQRFNGLNQRDQQDLLNFLRSL